MLRHDHSQRCPALSATRYIDKVCACIQAASVEGPTPRVTALGVSTSSSRSFCRGSCVEVVVSIAVTQVTRGLPEKRGPAYLDAIHWDSPRAPKEGQPLSPKQQTPDL